MARAVTASTAGSLLGEKLKCMITWSIPADRGVDIHGESEPDDPPVELTLHVPSGPAALEHRPSGHDVGHVIHREDREIETDPDIIHDQLPGELPGKRHVPQHGHSGPAEWMTRRP